ncbi:NAD(P)/FAD-dependent oxidoreductase [Bordetella tumulicola]|uniref:FAD/NAD(P)-dependent oxidoreductase n=1 Tax=Bordetella tumulicola TaxID=1649133 RepID=UPI0039F06016
MSDQKVDLVIIGAGPAGMAAACEARRYGLSVMLLDEQPAAGGQIYRAVDSAPADRVDLLGNDYGYGKNLTRAFGASGAEHLRGAAVWSVERDGSVHYLADGRSATVKGINILLASGAMERPFPVPGWTLPGVMTAGAAQILLKSAGALPDQPAVLAGCGPLLYLLAWQYLRAGAPIKAIVDTTPLKAYREALKHWDGALKGWRDLKRGLGLLRSIRRHGVAVYRGATHLGVLGDVRAQGLTFQIGGQPQRVESPLILLHQGVVPNTQLSLSMRLAHRWDSQQLCWTPVVDEWGKTDCANCYIAGDSAGIVGAKASAEQGRLVALDVALRANRLSESLRESLALPIRDALTQFTAIRSFLDVLYRPLDIHRMPADDVIVCRCEEVTAGQIRHYVELGCHGPNQTKAFGRCGMGPCQGRLCGLTVTELIADARKVDPQDIGYYRIRPPIKPITLGELAQ